MRAADRIGAGNFGRGRAPRSERGRAKAQTEGQIPDYELQCLQLARVAPCPLNPRRNYGSDDQQLALGESLSRKQTTACVAVTREAYLKLWPEHEELIGADADHVILNGERRYRAALRAGLETLDYVVRDDLAADQAEFLDSLLLENEDRENFDLIERAQGLKQLLDACDGNAAEVARRRNRDRSWVGNQIALLTLPTPVQDQLASGDLAERYGRRLARALKDDPTLDTEALLVLAEDLKHEDRNRRETDKALLTEAKRMLSADNIPAPATPMLSADNTFTPPHTMLSADNIPADAPVLSADNTPASAPSPAPMRELAAPMLSADNIPSPTSSSPSVLSADNTQPTPAPVPHQSPAPNPAPATLVRALGTTPEEQAATLRAGLDPAAFTALLEALHTFV